MKNDSSKVFSTIFISLFAVGISCVFFFSFVDNPKPAQSHGVYGLIVVGLVFTILAVAGELSKKNSIEPAGTSTIYKSSFLYFVIMTFVSLLYIVRWAESLSWFYAFHILSFLALSIALIAASTATGSVHEVNTKKVDLSAQVKDLRSRLSILCLQYSDAPWHTILVRCQEEVGLFDTDITVPVDVEITRLVGKLEKELQRQKEQAEAALVALEEEERTKKEAKEKLAIEGSEESLDEEDDEELFTFESDDEQAVKGDEEIEPDASSWIIEEEEEPSDIPSLVEELRQYVHQRNTEAKRIQKGKT